MSSSGLPSAEFHAEARGQRLDHHAGNHSSTSGSGCCVDLPASGLEIPTEGHDVIM